VLKAGAQTQVCYGPRTVELPFSARGLISKIWADTSTYQVVRTLKQFP
jgi:hypothetical protein